MFNRRRIVTLISTLTAILIFSSCTQKSSQNYLFGEDLDKAAKIFSTRPQNQENGILILNLSQPALLSALKTDKLKNVIDEDLSKAIQDEQNAVIAQLKQLNPEILVFYRYKMVLNALAIAAPIKDLEKIQSIPGVMMVKKSQNFQRPQTFESTSTDLQENITKNNSALFIGAKAALDKNIKGQNIKVGIIDTGIDYTHSMLGGSGDSADYKKINPNEPSSQFPNAKVVGGVDFVGTQYDSGSDTFSRRIPMKDANPIDEAGHGTHVAGTVAGIGDGVQSYNGVASSAVLYALKVFGAEGSTSDEVVIAALEYAADPNGDEILDDKLDVVNLSLGSLFGSPKILYNLAIKNLTLGGTVVVCSAGNSGDLEYIVGAPSVSDEALSVAASVDSMDHNWKFKAVSIQLADKSVILTEAVESSMTKKIASIDQLQGKLIYAGTANKDYSSEEAALIKDHVALIDRGEVTFAEKINRAQAAGAIGVVVVNNQDGNAFTMGGDGSFKIPAIMITKELGSKIKESMQAGDVVINFKVDKQIEKPDLIDTVTDFSSRGPRSEDSLIKPEISAPGMNIISAGMGKGKEAVQMSGTSMSGPHIAGVMALMKQYYPELSVAELKSVVMGTSKSMVDQDGHAYPIARVGAGRVQIDKALNATLASETSSLSFGEVRIDQQKRMLKSLSIKNLKPNDVSLQAIFEGNSALTMDPVNVSLTARGQQKVDLRFT
ncbi:MAG: S8 family serine peptidase, partial [Bdellovibrionales bacterium]|nr:S8 family serine peptidase [Bdellovibrionales bacterium]